MGLPVSPNDVRALESTLRTMLSPLEYADPDEWRLDAMRAARDLVGADVACFCLALDGRPTFQTEPEGRAAITALEEHFAPWAAELEVRRRELGLEVAHLSALVDMDAYRRTEFWTDYVVPYRLFDTTMLLADVGPGGSPAGLYFHHDEPNPRAPFGERELTLLRLLVPAVKAGVAGCLAGHRSRTALLRALDALPEGLMLTDVSGRVVHENPAVVRLLERDPAPERILWACRGTSRELTRLLDDAAAPVSNGGWPRPCRTIGTPAGTYRVRGTLLGGGSGADDLVLIAVEPRDAERADAAGLRERFGLSCRQAEVAVLLAARRTNEEIATELGISPHTARRHTEQVLLRLGVRSRRDVRARIAEAY